MSATHAAAPASPGETQPVCKRTTPYANCKNLGALRWLLMYGQGPDVRPYALRALLGYLTPALAAIAVVTVFGPGLVREYGPRAAQAAGLTQVLRYALQQLE